MHFFSRLDPGGAELRTVDVVAAVGGSFDFVAVSGAEGKLDAELRAAGHFVFPLKLRGPVGLLKCIRLFRRRGVHVAHAHLGPASGFVMLAARLSGVPVRIAHFRSEAPGGRTSIPRSVFLRLSRALVAAFATSIIGVSPGSLDRGWRADWRADVRCAVVPNGFDAVDLRRRSASTRSLRPSPVETLVLCNIGRIEPSKNRGRSIEIWRRLADTVSTKLLLVGEVNPVDRSTLQRLEGDSPLASAAVLVGDTRDVPSYLGSAHVLLMTSIREGLPGVVLEALACGVPVVASRIPSVQWVATQVPGIIMCDLADSDDVWVDAIRQASELDGDAIAKAFEHSVFSMEIAARSFDDLWELNARGTAVA